MSVVARFYVAEIIETRTGYASGPPSPDSTHEVVLRASTRGEENKTWAKYTPSGEIRLRLNYIAGPALEWFEDHLGRDCAITIDEAPEPTP